MKEITPENQRIDKISQPPQPGKHPGRDTGLAGEFSRILSHHLEPETSSAPLPSSGLPELDGTYAASLTRVSLAHTGVADQISESIDLLENYAQSLADPGATLKQAFDLLEQIGSQTREINRDMNNTQNKDPRLKEIITHLSTLVALEKIKINRGDYS